jgi:hypothetical protein
MSAAAAPIERPSETYGQVPFLLRAMGIHCVRIDEAGNPIEDPEDQAKENAISEDEVQKILEEAEKRKFSIWPGDPITPPAATEAGEPANQPPFELPQLTDAECEKHLQRLCTLEGEGAYPWETMNERILEGVSLGHITDVELAEWDALRNLYIECLTAKREKGKGEIDFKGILGGVEAREPLNYLLLWGIAIDFCCGIEVGAMFEGLGVKELGLCFEDLGFCVEIGDDGVLREEP